LLQKGSAVGEEARRLAERRRLLAEKAKLDEQRARLEQRSLDELRRQRQRLQDELAALGKQPAGKKKELRYRAPVAVTVQTDEVMFECRQGRVTLLDTGALLEIIRREVRSKGELLRSTYEVSDVTPPVGAFRLRYTVERERTGVDSSLPGGAPAGGGFRYGMTGWEAEPILSPRGETADAALRSGSAFRQVVDLLDAQQTAVTLWVYPDSFGLYRSLRDYLHERGLVVAGRPLPDGVPIASSRRGTRSRGQ
jgi:hypothetical protein